MEQNENNPKKLLSRVGLSMFLMAIAVIIANVLLDLSAHRFLPNIWSSDWYAWAVTAITVIGVAIPVLIISSKGIPDSEHGDIVKLSLSQFVTIFFICAATMYLTNYFGVFINFIIAGIKGDDIINPALEAITGSNFLVTFLYGAIAAPIAEEFIFRKILLNKVRRFGDLPAILITGFAFGLFHMNLAQFFYATALGFIFAYITIKTNTIRYSIVLHIMINTIGIAVTPLATDIQKNIGLLLVMFVWILTAISLGAVFFALNIKKIRFEKSDLRMKKKSDYILNLGTMLFVVLCLAMTVRVILL